MKIGGKRLRAMLVYATGEAYNADPDALIQPPVPFEMDTCLLFGANDDMPIDGRMMICAVAKPTCHKA